MAGDSATRVAGRCRSQQCVLGLELPRPAQRTTEFDLGAQDREQACVLPGLLDEVPCPAMHRLDRHVDRPHAVITTTGKVWST